MPAACCARRVIWMRSTDVLDTELLAQLEVDLGDGETVRMLIATYLGELEMRRQAIVDALATGDVSQVAYAAHALVSPSRTLGVVSLAGPARAIEVMAKNGRLDGADAELARLDAAMPRAIGALNGW
jgi:HPt (histidine-containing phosphotransfer) domain-containing protein